MADESLSKSSFLQGLSDLWLRFFADKNQLQALYKGTEIVIGQAYLDLLTSVLNISLREAPLFEKEYFKLLTVREDQVTYRAADQVYVFELPDNIKAFKFLFNKIWAPTVALEEDIDFAIDITGDTDDLVFYFDPFDWDASGEAIPGVALRTVEVDSVTYKELSFWIPDAQCDRFDMYLSYGYLLNRFEPSSESYRALLQGISRYFVLGPTFQHILSALSVIVGLPVIRDDGEILQEVDTTTETGYAIVKTDKQDYKFDSLVPLRTDVLDESNWEVLTFEAFEHLTEAFSIKDAVTDPEWFFDITIPSDVMPDETRQRRALSPHIFDNLIDNPPGLVKIGDPGFFIGADDTGLVPPGSRPPKRHLFSYIVFERFLKHHMYTVILDQVFYFEDVIPFPRLDADILSVMIAGKSAYVYLYLEHGPEFHDSMVLTDYPLEFSLEMTRAGRLDEIAAPLQIGLRSWKIGDYFTYNVSGGITIANGTPDRSLGETSLVIGGEDPNRHGRIAAVGSNTRRPLAAGTNASFARSGPVVRVTVDNAVFHEQGDVGKFIRHIDLGVYYEILSYVSSTIVVVDMVTGFPVAGQNWELWNYEGEEEESSCWDWPVQIKITP